MRHLSLIICIALVVALAGCDSADPYSTADAGGGATVSGPSEMRPGDTCTFTLNGGTVSSLGWGADYEFTVVNQSGNWANIRADYIDSSGHNLVFAHSTLGYPIKKKVTVSHSAPPCEF